ncbi:type III pantothenate kinase [Campylobacter sp. VBCF_06 NA8]|uniref:type III pantothenate kinase n=1 Tax=unclassified Campylobacter TaxID=2593542 RepID=UPI0022E9A14D|nr:MULTISPECIES: type III pantothenate kinase [unclassified Campylobacter]MDA3043649.1 type III pantothenate kinase [Campylobacter sp. JMF_09 ED2]MDA3045389.1 type III pantothenate kinase [Campylobacter sp. JMF_07 ED4]MDA3046819.1 type III pantothenate kinase [Campylobacter sp. VBCF_06 NA8]MDA3050083.1 type III pantothenate kinase [Campylobacter sp. JMF_15 NE4]MDA3051771.1 type III pantothenate kinase [Campylobacter sp. JMF_02 ED1]
MLLCDIGNTHAKFYDNGATFAMGIDEFLNYEPIERVYCINVNARVQRKLNNPLFIDITHHFHINTTYQGLGIDRIVACSMVETGVIVDAGSAITVDVMEGGTHLGGFILPGIHAMLRTYGEISSVLDVNLSTKISLDSLPQKTSDAVNYGIFKPTILAIADIAGDKRIHFTGGDGAFLMRHFKNGVYDRDLIFRAMKNLISQKGLL